MPGRKGDNYVLAEAYERINNGISELSYTGVNSVILIGHGVGASIGAAYAASSQVYSNSYNPVGLFGLIMVGHRGASAQKGTPYDSASELHKLHMPVLDIHMAGDSYAAGTSEERKIGFGEDEAYTIVEVAEGDSWLV